jgi:hypothetical protein
MRKNQLIIKIYNLLYAKGLSSGYIEVSRQGRSISPFKNPLKLAICYLLLITCYLFTSNAIAGSLTNRLQQYPEWDRKPSVKIAQGDLHYPQWMAGTWQVKSTLIEQIAPLAPEIITPGFADNQQYLARPIKFLVRFGSEYFKSEKKSFLPKITNNNQPNPIVADRVFNGEQIAAAYLGAQNLLKVKIDPHNTNKQINLFQGDRQLISTVTGRATETPTPDRFIATEVTKQLFKSPERIYLNEVETTSDYQLIRSGEISAQQITAIYLSPQDPDYFQASDRPVAIYHYQLELKSEE